MQVRLQECKDLFSSCSWQHTLEISRLLPDSNKMKRKAQGEPSSQASACGVAGLALPSWALRKQQIGIFLVVYLLKWGKKRAFLQLLCPKSLKEQVNLLSAVCGTGMPNFITKLPSAFDCTWSTPVAILLLHLHPVDASEHLWLSYCWTKHAGETYGGRSPTFLWGSFWSWCWELSTQLHFHSYQRTNTTGTMLRAHQREGWVINFNFTFFFFFYFQSWRLWFSLAPKTSWSVKNWILGFFSTVCWGVALSLAYLC